jgi:pyruvate/2-oxoglutarate dehydrogenase complex dihydrolipoamide dehydrogenase (E3) component
MTVENYQNLVIGSGVAGKLIAWTLAKQGQKTVVVERSMVGGSCPNVACLPSKKMSSTAPRRLASFTPPRVWGW